LLSHRYHFAASSDHLDPLPDRVVLIPLNFLSKTRHPQEKVALVIQITPELSIDESEIQESFIRSSGPGGQNVNKVSTGVQLRFNVVNSSSLPVDVKERLVKLGGSRLTADGVLVIDAHRFRTQEHNRRDALSRLVDLIARAAQAPRRRVKTLPSQASRLRRLEQKRRRGEIKKMRRQPLD
jgi:ribosome-associated protein